LSDHCRWFDAGLNLFAAQFAERHQQLLDDGIASAVDSVLLISSDLAESQLNLAFTHPIVRTFATAGVHPHQAAQVGADWQQQLSLLLQNAVAVGECGLDYNRMFSPKPQQQQVFATQLQLARSLNKAVYLHERDAFADQVAMLSEAGISRGIAHCFTGDTQQLKTYLDLGLYIGITGWLCDERRGEALQQALQYLPLDRLILETDAPYLLPRTIKPKPKSGVNQPAYLPAIAAQVALLRQLPLEEVAQHSYDNCCQLFGVPA